jgi:hypothetical protein
MTREIRDGDTRDPYETQEAIVRSKSFHARYHWYMAKVLSTLHLYTRGAHHIDRWITVCAPDLEMHVLHPNSVRKGCRMYPIYETDYDGVLKHQ